MNKKEYINYIMEDLEENFYNSRRLIMQCTESYLNSMSFKDLKDFYEIPDEEEMNKLNL